MRDEPISMTTKRGGHMDRLEVGAVHQAMPQGIIEHGAQTAEQVQQATGDTSAMTTAFWTPKQVFEDILYKVNQNQ